MSDSAIDRLVATWDDAVARFIGGESSVIPELESWFASYTGRSARGAVDLEAMPEPFLGVLDGAPRMVFLALNPGRSFPFQRRGGAFVDRVEQLGSYQQWAATWPYLNGDWEAQGRRPNRHHQSRLRFMRRWHRDESIPASAMVAFELYPWHSTSITASMTPDPAIVRRFVWDPIVELGCPYVFAFGAPWFSLLGEHLGLETIAVLGRGGKPYPTAVRSRTVCVLGGAGGLRVIAEKHSGGAGPPSPVETQILREACESVS